MTPEERQMLTDLASKIAQTPPPAHDAEAEDFIRKNIGSRPDALYLMTQTVLIQNMAIEHAQREIQQLKQQTAPPASGGGFLGGNPAYGQPQPQYAQQPQYAPPPPGYGAPPMGGPGASGMGSFLRSAGTTAAGVAAGALAFEGIRSMFGGGFGGGGFGGGEHTGFGHQGGGSGFLDRPEETIVNNYYDNPSGGGRDNYDDASTSTVADDLGPDDSVQYDDSADIAPDDSSSSDDLS